MSFDRDFFDMMPALVAYQAYSGISTGGYGMPTNSTSTGQTVRARIQAVREDVRELKTREIVGATFKVLMAPWSTAGTSDTVRVTPLDKIILPTGFLVAGSCSPPIVKAYPVDDEDGFHHNEVWI
jgi:hypothetical protein